MTTLKITLARYNSDGLIAYIEDDDMNDLEIHCSPGHNNAKRVCLTAAHKLRLLADAYEILAAMEQPLTPANQALAMRRARKNQQEAAA